MPLTHDLLPYKKEIKKHYEIGRVSPAGTGHPRSAMDRHWGIKPLFLCGKYPEKASTFSDAFVVFVSVLLVLLHDNNLCAYPLEDNERKKKSLVLHLLQRNLQ